MDIPRYIHYGATEFIPTKGFPIKNLEYFMKPKGGLWASRKNASFGWKDWCEQKDFRHCDMENSFEFTFTNQAKIVTISTVQQLHNLPQMEDGGLSWCYSIDFEKCLHLGIDAIELCWYGNEYRDVAFGDLYNELYGWDCDSIVVLNPDAIKQIDNQKRKRGIFMYIIKDLTKSVRPTYHIRDAKDAKDIVIGITGNDLYGCEALNIAVNMHFGDRFLRSNLYSIRCVEEY